jgi:hypothetical protein
VLTAAHLAEQVAEAGAFRAEGQLALDPPLRQAARIQPRRQDAGPPGFGIL